MTIITIASLKGGAGKTALAVNLALEFARRGQRVLAADMDANNNLTDFFLRGVPTATLDAANILHALSGERAVSACVHRAENAELDVLPATIALADLSARVNGDPVLLLGLGSALRETNYEYVIIDSPPYRGSELRAALWSADLVLSPVTPRRWLLQGARFLETDLAAVERFTGRAADLRFVCSMAGTNQRDVARIDALRERYSFFSGTIPKSASIDTALEGGRVLRPGSRGQIAFSNITDEVLAWQKTNAAAVPKNARASG